MILRPGMLALFLCSLIVVCVYVTHDANPMAFVLQGARFASEDPRGSRGYDGQFAYYIAVDPIGALGRLDNPAYRYQRILYPMLARLLALGRPALVPWMLLLINVVSISLSSELVGRILERRRFSPYLALAIPLWLGQVFALRADLNEPLCFLLAALACWWYERRRYGASAAALAASALAKEAGLLFLPAFVIVLWLRKRRLAAFWYALIILFPYVLLQVGLYLFIGRPGLANIGVRFERIPFYGFAFVEPLAARIFAILFFAAPDAILLVLAIGQLARTPRSIYAWALLFQCLLFLARRTCVDMLAVFRTATGIVMASLLFCAAHRLRLLSWILLAVWLPSSVLAVMIPGFLF